MKQLKVLLFNAAFLIIILFLVEGLLRIVTPNYGFYTPSKPGDNFDHSSIDTNWVQPDPELGWVCKQKTYLKFHTPEFFDIEYDINPQGFRNNFDFDNQIEGKKKVMLLGDSFAFGFYSAEEFTISSKLHEKLGSGYQIYNISSPGWGLDQMYLAYLKYVEAISPDIVVILYIDDDIMRMMEAFRTSTGPKPYLCFNKNRVTPCNRPISFLERLSRQSQLLNRIYRRYTQYNAMRLAKAITKEVVLNEKSAGREVLMCRIPVKEHVFENDKQWFFGLHDAFSDHPENYVELNALWTKLKPLQQEKLYLENDPHLSEDGNLYLAEILAQRIRNEMLIDTN